MSETNSNFVTVSGKSLAKKLKKRGEDVALDKVYRDALKVNNRGDLTDADWRKAPEFSSLVDAILAHGQRESGIVELIDDKYLVLVGNGRSIALADLKAAGAIDPRTGRTFNTFRADVYVDLTPAERIAIVADQSQRRLDKIGQQLTAEQCFASGMDDKQTAIVMLPLLSYNGSKKLQRPSPSNGSTEDNARFERELKTFEEALKNAKRGAVQNMRHIFNCPDVAHDDYMANLRGLPCIVGPNVTQMVALSKVHARESKTDARITKANPGPEFLQEWGILVKATAEARANGDEPTRAKSVGMMTRQTLDAIDVDSDSPWVRVILWSIKRENGLGDDTFPKINTALVALDKGDKPTADAILAEVMATVKANKPAAPVKDQTVKPELEALPV